MRKRDVSVDIDCGKVLAAASPAPLAAFTAISSNRCDFLDLRQVHNRCQALGWAHGQLLSDLSTVDIVSDQLQLESETAGASYVSQSGKSWLVVASLPT